MKKILVLFGFLLSLGVWSVVGGAEEIKKVEVNMQVLLISIENYELAPLQYASNDIEKLSSLFQTRFGAVSRAVIDRPNTGNDYKTAMEKVISEWCQNLKEKDTCILYLAGHGVVGPDERLYLPMVDFNRRNFDTAAIPMEWIREQLAQAKGKCKLILLDTCFAGTGKSFDDFALSNSEEMAKTFETLPKVATLASSRADQKSWLWQERKHSLYTFWLIEGFRGNADLNNDMTLDVDELFNYLEENIAWVSESDPMMEPQTPILLNDSQIKETFRLPLLAANSKDTLENAASQLDLHLRRLPEGMVLVPEFTTGPIGEEPVIQDNYGTLPRRFAANLQSQLVVCSRGTRHYKVANANTTQKILRENQLTPADLGTDTSANLQIKGKPIQYLVLGRLYHAPKQIGIMEMEISLIDAQEQDTIATFHTKIQLSSSELGECGISAALPSRQNLYPDNEYVPTDGGLVEPNAAVVLGQMIQDAEKVNPMMDGNIPFKVEIYVRKAGSRDELTLRTGKVVGNEYYLPLNKGEEYQIWVRNNSNQLQYIRVLVDGMNTLSQSTQTYSKGAIVEPVPTNTLKPELAPIVALENARAWAVKPESVLQVAGFYEVNNGVPTQSGLYRFELGDADESLGARKSYTEQLGRITIGIYQGVQPATRRSVRSPGTKIQDREQIQLKIDDSGLLPAEHPTVIYNLRYLSQEEYDEQ
ncbi:MAG: caspase family protein [Planctomycetia bacterium]|nr:caspase family protein [Planctomycetia bacterium]